MAKKKIKKPNAWEDPDDAPNDTNATSGEAGAGPDATAEPAADGGEDNFDDFKPAKSKSKNKKASTFDWDGPNVDKVEEAAHTSTTKAGDADMSTQDVWGSFTSVGAGKKGKSKGKDAGVELLESSDLLEESWPGENAAKQTPAAEETDDWVGMTAKEKRRLQKKTGKAKGDEAEAPPETTTGNTKPDMGFSADWGSEWTKPSAKGVGTDRGFSTDAMDDVPLSGDTGPPKGGKSSKAKKDDKLSESATINADKHSFDYWGAKNDKPAAAAPALSFEPSAWSFGDLDTGNKGADKLLDVHGGGKKDEEDTWGAFGGTGKKKSAQKGTDKNADKNMLDLDSGDIGGRSKNSKIDEVVLEGNGVSGSGAGEEDWGGFGSGGKKKKEKKSKTATFETEYGKEEEKHKTGAALAADADKKKATGVEDPDDWFADIGKTSPKKKGGASQDDASHKLKDDFSTEFLSDPKTVNDGDDDWGNSWSTGTKKKQPTTKRDKLGGITEVGSDANPYAAPLLPESVQEKPAEEDSPWTTGTKGKKKGLRKNPFDPPPPPAPTPPDQGLDDPLPPPPPLLGGDDGDGAWDFGAKKSSSKDTKTKKAAKAEDPKSAKSKSKWDDLDTVDILAIVDEAEAPAKDTKPESPKEDKKSSSKSANSWGSLWGSNSKPAAKSSKEKDKDATDKVVAEDAKKAKEDAFAAALGDDSNDLLDIVDEAPPKKSSKDKDLKSSKSKVSDRLAKDKAEAEDTKKKAKDKDFTTLLDDDAHDILHADEASTKKSTKDKDVKSSKTKGSDKLPEADSKLKKKTESKSDPISAKADPYAYDPDLDFGDGFGDIKAKSDPKKKGDKDKVDDGTGSAAGWGFWGSTAKSTTKATPAAETKKEIDATSPANWKSSLTDRKKTEVGFDDEATSPLKSAKDASTKSKSISNSKNTPSIQDRIKALQGDREVEAASAPAKKSAGAKSKSAAPLPPPPPAPEIKSTITPPSPDEKKSSFKDRKSTAAAVKSSSSSSKHKEYSPPPADAIVVPPPPSASPLPGGFPDEDLFDFSKDMSSAAKKSSSKDKKSATTKSTKMDSSKSKGVAVPPPAPAFDDFDGFGDAKLPTPPPEKASKDDSRGLKKERPKVVRDQDSKSWGFWGATPPPKSSGKKESSRSKDGGSLSPTKDRPAGPTRSKSTRKPGDRDPLEKTSKSSGSDKDVKSATKARPSTSRGMSFSGMFGKAPPPPSRSKSTREKSSRRDSVAVDDTGLASPPPGDRSREMSAKAAEVMGVKRGKSTRDKSKSRKVPDPYAIDSDDMIMVDGPEDSAKDMPSAGGKDRKPRKSKRDPAMMSGGLGGGDDAVMVDAEDKADDLAFDVRPPLVKRSASSAKKPGLMGGLLGAFASRPAATPDRRQSKVYDESEDGLARRKRGSAYDDDGSKRLRREDRKVGRGLVDGVPAPEAEDPAVREARRAERRAKRDREAAEEEEARVQRRETRRAKAKEEEDRLAEEDARHKEERRARRADKEARRAEEDRAAQEEEDAKTAERRERRRERQRTEEDSASRPKTSERRKSYADGPVGDEAHRMRRERRSVDQGVADNDKDRPRPSRRRSEFPAAAAEGGYEDKRSGELSPSSARDAPRAPLADRSFVKPGDDKTASWVDSLNNDPPPPPPVEGTIIDAPAVFSAESAGVDPFEDTTAREMRQKKMQSRDGYGDEEGERRRRRRDLDGEYGMSVDGGSFDRRRSYAGPGNGLGVDSAGLKTWDGRPAIPQRGDSRRGSWFKKIAGL